MCQLNFSQHLLTLANQQKASLGGGGLASIISRGLPAGLGMWAGSATRPVFNLLRMLPKRCHSRDNDSSWLLVARTAPNPEPSPRWGLVWQCGALCKEWVPRAEP